jgi:hypothetical protein
MHAEPSAAPKPKIESPSQSITRVGFGTIAILFLFSAIAVSVHGYHPFIEDAEIYVPGIKKLLNPALYPYNQGFFASHAKLTLFPNLIAGSVRLTHLPLEWVLLAWHVACIFSLLLACWKLGRLCFGSARAGWGSALLVASLLTIPVAGTALYIMDQYLNTRSFSTAAAVWIVLATAQRKYLHASIWVFLTVFLHPLMAVFGAAFAGLLIWQQHRRSVQTAGATAMMFLPTAMFPPVSGAYRQVLDGHSYFFLLRWHWYEWLGIAGPLAILWFLGRAARQTRLAIVEGLCRTTVTFGLLFSVAALLLSIPPQSARFAELQPMRSLHLVFILLFVISGGWLAEWAFTSTRNLRLSLFAALALLNGGMLYAQRQLFRATPHLEFPGRNSTNAWVEAFTWIRDDTPVDAYFALDPDHMRLPGEDQHGFRAIAERSMLADRVKDSGAVSMFPALAETWSEQVQSQAGWTRFRRADFELLRSRYGVDWLVLQQPGVAGLECPYSNPTVLVCRIPLAPGKMESQ